MHRLCVLGTPPFCCLPVMRLLRQLSIFCQTLANRKDGYIQNMQVTSLATILFYKALLETNRHVIFPGNDIIVTDGTNKEDSFDIIKILDPPRSV